MDDIRLFVSLVNWHLTFRLEHSEQELISVASHFTFLSLHASQDGSFRLCLYALFCACCVAVSWTVDWTGVEVDEPFDMVLSIPIPLGEVVPE